MNETSRHSILVLDDEPRQREILSLLLRDAGYEVTTSSSPIDALETIETGGPFDLVLCDLRMPIMDGIEFLTKVREIRTGQVVIVITAHGTISTAVEAIKRGAFHYLTKPLDREEFLIAVQRAVDQSHLRQQNVLLKDQLKKDYSIENIVGRHGKMQQVFRLVRKVAPTRTSVILYGESGTGKELVARAIHQLSPRSGLAMHAVNCAAIPEALLESELFGYEKGAFTGAYTRKKGLLEQSSGSTLLLDEVGDLEGQLQGKLLRVLQERETQRLGGSERIPLDVRIISSTNRDLGRMVRDGDFREDLFYRLNTFPIVLPPLRERVTDIPILTEYFLKKFSGTGNASVKGIAPAAMRVLMTYDWPGNVRQLESVVERAVILSEGELVQETELPPEIIHQARSAGHLADFDLPSEGVDLEELEKHLIKQAMQRADGVMARAAPLLGLSYRTLQYRLQKYGLTTPDTE